jgi:hypothetical protein
MIRRIATWLSSLAIALPIALTTACATSTDADRTASDEAALTATATTATADAAPPPCDIPAPTALCKIRTEYVCAGQSAQQYTCGADGKWAQTGVGAILFPEPDCSGEASGTHGGKPPYWKHGGDGSGDQHGIITPPPISSPNGPGNIACLSIPTTEGCIVTRTNTGGGTAPSDACTPGAQMDVPYSATYTTYCPCAVPTAPTATATPSAAVP